VTARTASRKVDAERRCFREHQLISREVPQGRACMVGDVIVDKRDMHLVPLIRIRVAEGVESRIDIVQKQQANDNDDADKLVVDAEGH
jgi:hypothetical protein